MTKCLVAEYETKLAARVGLEQLEHAGFSIQSVSVVSSAEDPGTEYLHHLHDEADRSSTASAPEGRGTTLGMLIGGTIAAPIAAGTLVGPFIIAGPLVGIAIGAAIGSLAGMHRWGVSHDVAKDYERRVQSGSLLIIVHDVEQAKLEDADTILNTTKPKSLEKYEMT